MSKVNLNNQDVEPATSPKKAVYMMRAKGQSWEDFKKAFVESLTKAGLVNQQSEVPERIPDGAEMQAHNLNEQILAKDFPESASTIPTKKEDLK